MVDGTKGKVVAYNGKKDRIDRRVKSNRLRWNGEDIS